jgi:hypothetical protein
VGNHLLLPGVPEDHSSGLPLCRKRVPVQSAPGREGDDIPHSNPFVLKRKWPKKASFLFKHKRKVEEEAIPGMNC